MRQPFTIQDILKSPCGNLNKHLEAPVIRKKRSESKEKIWIGFRLEEFAKERGLILETEYRFDEVRKWRFDWAFPELKTAFEYNGLFSNKSRHTTVTGYTGDMEKLNSAQSQGWKVLQFTALNYLDLTLQLNKL